MSRWQFRFHSAPLLVLALALSVPAQTNLKLEYMDIHKPLPSTALIIMPRVTGSGFMVDYKSRLVITNFHVVGRSKTVGVVFPIYKMNRALVTRAFYLSRKVKRLHGKVIAADPSRDLAVIELPQLPRGVPEVPLAPASPKVGSKTHMIGNPGDNKRAWVYSAGKVTGLDRQRIQYRTGQKVDAMMTHVITYPRFGPGISGGPAVNSAGQLVGVMSAQKTKEPRHKLYIDVSEVRVFLGQAQRRLATDAIRARDYRSAIELCSRSIKSNPNDPVAYNERGVAFSFRKSYDSAIVDYSSAIKLSPKFYRAWRNRGSAFLRKGEYGKAVEDCTQAIRINSSYARAYLTRSQAHEKLGNTAQAKADRTTAYRIDSSLKK